MSTHSPLLALHLISLQHINNHSLIQEGEMKFYRSAVLTNRSRLPHWEVSNTHAEVFP